ncbi:spore coat U domain-containing protein (plasmid) [Phyllobacterium sp. 628]|uniref:Csu type fimbrial protein n=1 Tax=Phyllobacterium sp. 628 TaxID=2718938 RepID=UPI00166280C1|nr:spore coat U domain-containing protein [Phyllobacterium sp. 628]QND55112.1 spore coat U domain-containing protein [Phyllobacterium sp. 628]
MITEFSKQAIIVAGVVAALGFSNPVFAATATGSFTVQITIQSSCILVSAATLTFTSVGVIAANDDSSSALSVQCTNTTPYNIGLDAGTGAGASVAARKMTGPAGALVTYSLYSDTSRSALWGQTIGTDTVAGTGNGAAQPYTVYGRVPPQTTPAAGAYTDTVTVTITY